MHSIIRRALAVALLGWTVLGAACAQDTATPTPESDQTYHTAPHPVPVPGMGTATHMTQP